jgi:hypothetical protein
MENYALGVIWMNKKFLYGSICIVLFVVSLGTVIMLGRIGDNLQLKGLESQVLILNSQLSTAKNEKSAWESQVLDFQAEVAALETEKSSLLSQVSSLQSEVTSLESAVTKGYSSGFEDGEASGYQRGLADGSGIEYDLRDPTYAEVVEFIASDQTDKNIYASDYVCVNFAADLKSNAFYAGFRAGCVYLQFPERYHHGIVCFNTVDRGLIFVEPQTDEIVTVKIGEVYYNRVIYEPP